MILSCTTRPPPPGVSRDVCTIRRHAMPMVCSSLRIHVEHPVFHDLEVGVLRLPLRDMLVLSPVLYDVTSHNSGR